MKTNSENYKYIKAKSRVEKLKSIYRHVAVYLITIALLFLIKMLYQGSHDSVFYIIFSYSADVTWIVWGFVVVLHAIIVLGLDKILGRNWEADKITKYMNEDDRQLDDPKK